MRFLYRLTLLLLPLLITGCLETVYPFFHKEDIEFDDHLVGTWQYDNGSQKGFIRFARIDNDHFTELPPGVRDIANKGYFVTYLDSVRKPGKRFICFLARIGGDHYLDRYPANLFDPAVLPQFREHFIKLHSCVRLTRRSPLILEHKLLEQSYFDALHEQNKVRLNYLQHGSPGVNGRIVAANTDELQVILRKYGNDPRAYNKDHSYTCKKVSNQ